MSAYSSKPTAPVAALRLLALACMLSCGDSPSPPEALGASGDLPAIPGLDGAGACVDDGSPIHEFRLESWALAADVLLVGTVERVELLREPALVSQIGTPQFTDAAGCEELSGRIGPGLTVTLGSLEVLSGDFAASSVQVALGHRIIDQWDSKPRDDGTALEWIGPGAIVPGQRIGLLLWRDPDWQVETTFGFRLLSIDSDNVATLQMATEECPGSLPSDVHGHTTDELRNQLATAPSSPSVAESVANLRDAILGGSADGRRIHISARCFVPDHPVGECATDSDCDAGSSCRNGSCLSP